MPAGGDTGIPNTVQYNGTELEVSQELREGFEQDGFILVKNLLSKEELELVETSVTGPSSLTSYSYGNDDGEGRMARMCLWNNPGWDTTGRLARTRKLAGTAAELLKGEVYHYHSKLMMKDAGTGGKFVWHQDYGYWYNFGCLYPDMLTAFIAIDRCGKDNGCLQILKGSHKCGRIEHTPVAGQVGADPARVAELEIHLDKIHVEMNPGDTMFFHSNLLHTSSSNDSPHRRWAILSCYNRRTNNPTIKFCAQYNHLELLDNDAVAKHGISRDLAGKEIMMKGEDGKYITIEVGADPARVAELEKHLDKIQVEMNPGDTLFFHSNLLHTSSSNDSPHRRWAILSCYNRRTNDPTSHFHANYNKLEIVDNDDVIKHGVSRDLMGKEVLKKVDGKFITVGLRFPDA